MDTTRIARTLFFVVLCSVVFPLANRTQAETFNLTQQPGEHPLQPVIRTLEEVRNHMDQNVSDYSSTLVKQERIEGELGERQYILLKVLNQPFSVYMKFLQPHTDREVLYVAGMNDGNLIALEGGWKRRIMSPVSLDPEGMIAMRGQKYPITNIGLRNLVSKIIERASAELKFAECEVTSNPEQQVEGRSATLIQVKHPTPRQEFHSHIARIFIDNESKIPLHYDSFSWPTSEGGRPLLEDSYTYTNLKLNNGFGARDFDKENPEIFKQ